MKRIMDSRLIGDDGKPLFGVHAQPIRELNFEDYRLYGQEKVSHAKNEFLKDFQLKRWQYLGVCGGDFTFGLAIVHLGYLSNAFAYLFDRGSKVLTEFNANQALAAHTEFSGSAVEGFASFKLSGADIEISNSGPTSLLKAAIHGKFDADLSFTHDIAPMSIVTRVGLDRFNYTNKESGIKVSGSVRSEGRSYDSGDGKSMGIIDYTFGYLARYTFWNWASGAGFDRDGRRIGFNLVQGVNETGFTENAFWIDGELEKTDVIDFRYDDLDSMAPWRIESNDGKVNLDFVPEGQRASKLNLGIISSRFRQPFGRFSGSLAREGKIYAIDSIAGFVEEHESKW
jgi:hypothetical protein